ncbi:4'-phosphopantetheinyl transferase family protein [Streptomyces sp. NPDC004082]|uniref:4'-phosphopantetheinyl transferase family protein n=1 Tax=unclassified Streptomyces TaxID=2593676 RepID=UPI0033B47559
MATADVWWWRIPVPFEPADLALLSPAERARVDRARTPRAKASVVGSRAGVRRALGVLLGARPEDIELGRAACPCCGAPDKGPPVVLRPAAAPHISISHADGCAALAVSERLVGVDVERRRALATTELASVALSPAERAHLTSLAPGPAREAAFLRCWTRKEAVLKAVGIGVTTDLTRLESDPAAPGPVRVTAGARPGDTRPWSVTDLPLPTPWTASLAVATTPTAPRPPEIRLHGPLTPRGDDGWPCPPYRPAERGGTAPCGDVSAGAHNARHE